MEAPDLGLDSIYTDLDDRTLAGECQIRRPLRKSTTISIFRAASTHSSKAYSVYALREGFDQIGIKRNQGLGITEDLMDARSSTRPGSRVTSNWWTKAQPR